MNRFLAVIAVGLLVAADASAQLATFSFAGVSSAPATLSASSLGSNIQSGTLSRGIGISANAGSNQFNSTGYSTNGTQADALANDDYLSIAITTASGGTYSFAGATVSFTASRSGSGPSSAILRSSFDNFASNLGSTLTINTGAGSKSFDISSLATQTTALTAIEFRIYAYGATSGAGTFQLTQASNLVVNGSFTPVPEPATLLVVAAAGLGLARLRRRLV